MLEVKAKKRRLDENEEPRSSVGAEEGPNKKMKLDE